MQDVLILNGPNLNLLGTREPGVYGSVTLADLEAQCIRDGQRLGLAVSCRQSNHEGELVSAIQEAGHTGSWVVFNPGAYTHTSIALHDAIIGSRCNVIEVHISNIHARETFRHHSYIAPVAKGSIVGLGTSGYSLALQAIRDHLTT
ncbi:MAG: type II 3-dehydroquinate dehydratase [Rhizobiales bacterium]|nr:type II 3-dehydroquinate dehydratase [Hyphomicrobiales bacterium]